MQRQNVTIHAREPLPAEAGPLLDDVLRRVSRSPLYDARRAHHVFLCDTAELFALFTLWNHRSGGVTNTWPNGNVFIRPASVRRGRVIGPSGVEKGGERTLAYYVAHEVTHAMTADHVGRLHYQRLSAFQVEGYADYVAFAQSVPVTELLGALQTGAKTMNPRLSGHYDRYRLLVGYLLRNKGWSVSELLGRRVDARHVETELRASGGDEPGSR